jgi:4-amino-4-deoxy-L-arabinose transferase-like glycosyltransferase
MARLARGLRSGGTYLLPLALLVALWLPGCNDGWPRTDSHYYAALSMNAWRTGELLDLRLGDLPYHNKPPLALLVHGLFLHVLGPQVWVTRLPSLLAACVAVWAVTRAVRLLSTRELALASGVVLATSMEFARYTRAISLDLWLAMFMALALLAGVSALRSGRAWRLVWAGVMIGLGLMVKPFVALLGLVLLLAWVAWAWRRVVPGGPEWDGRDGRGRLALAAVASVLAAVLVAAPWHIAMAVSFPDAFLGTFVVEQSLERLSKPAADPWYFYLRVMGESHWPWLIALIGCVVALAQSRHREAGPHGKRLMPLLVLVGLWCGAWLLAITLTGDKHGRYAVPVYMLLCVPAGWWLVLAMPRVVARVRRHAASAGVGLVAGSALVAMGLHAGGVELQRPREAAWDVLVAALDEAGARGDEPRVWVTRAANTQGANLVLLGRPWPRLVPGGGSAGADGGPGAGDFVVMLPDEAGLGLERLGRVLRVDELTRGRDVLIVRLGGVR